MPRRMGSHGARRVVPGVASGVEAWFMKMNNGFCMRPLGRECWWCGVLADLRAGHVVELQGSTIWHGIAAREDVARRHRDLINDPGLWRITGPDSLEAVPE